MIELYDYQKRAIDEARLHLTNHNSVALIAGCGAGKTIIAAELCRLINNKNLKILIIVPYISLLNQFRESLLAIGFNESEIGINEHHVFTKVAVMMAQTIESRGIDFDYQFVIWDEAHISYFRKNTQSKLNGKYKEILFTATPWRADGAKFPCKLIQIASTRELIEKGKNSKYTYYHLSADYQLTDIDRSLEHERQYLSAIAPPEQLIKLPVFDRKTVFFFSKKAIAREYIDYFQQQTGKTILLISDTTPIGKDELSEKWNGTRSHAFRLFRDGKCLLATVTCLAIGFDEKCVDAIVMVRSFSKQGFALFTQIIGRGLRSHHGKSECLIYGCGSYFPLPDDYDNWNSPIIPSTYTGLECPSCKTINGNGYSHCYKCGHQLPSNKSDSQKTLEQAIQLFIDESLTQFPTTQTERSRRYNKSKRFVERLSIANKSPEEVYKIYLQIAVGCGLKLGWAYFQFKKVFPDIKPAIGWRLHAIFGENPTHDDYLYFRDYIHFTGAKSKELIVEFGKHAIAFMKQ